MFNILTSTFFAVSFKSRCASTVVRTHGVIANRINVAAMGVGCTFVYIYYENNKKIDLSRNSPHLLKRNGKQQNGRVNTWEEVPISRGQLSR